MWSTADIGSHMRLDRAFCQSCCAALHGGHERHCGDSSWSDDDFDERCVSVHRPRKSDRSGAVTYCTQCRLNKAGPGFPFPIKAALRISEETVPVTTANVLVYRCRGQL